MKKQLLLFLLMLLLMVGCGPRKAPALPAEEPSNYDAPSDEPEVVKPAKDDPVIGRFSNEATGDSYTFYDDGKGDFYTFGRHSDFTWKHEGDLVIVTHELTGREVLYYDKEKNKILEESELHGTIIHFKKVF